MSKAAEDRGDASPSSEPRRTASLVGHDAAEQTLLEAWNSGRLPHAWLISGAKGIGKSTLAFRFARFVLGQAGAADAGPDLFGGPPAKPQSLAVSPEDPVFARIASGGHADLLTIERAIDDKSGKLRSEIVVNDVRKLGDFYGLTAAEGGWRVAIIDSADDMNTNSANALLKVLEEPPPRGLILVVAHAPGGLVPTIRSRCRRLDLRPLSEADTLAVLAEKLPDEPEPDRLALARLSEGSPGRALALHAAGGLELYRRIVDVFATLPRLDIDKAHRLGDEFARKKSIDDFMTFGDLLRWWLARMVRFGAAGGAAGLGEIVPGEAALMADLGTRGTTEGWIEAWEKAGHLVNRTDAVNLDRKQAVLGLLSIVERAAA